MPKCTQLYSAIAIIQTKQKKVSGNQVISEHLNDEKVTTNMDKVALLKRKQHEIKIFNKQNTDLIKEIVRLDPIDLPTPMTKIDAVRYVLEKEPLDAGDLKIYTDELERLVDVERKKSGEKKVRAPRKSKKAELQIA